MFPQSHLNASAMAPRVRQIILFRKKTPGPFMEFNRQKKNYLRRRKHVFILIYKNRTSVKNPY